MKKLVFTLLFAFSCFLSNVVFSQEVRYGCATDEQTQELYQKDTEFRLKRQLQEEAISRWVEKASTENRQGKQLKIIPVVVHVIHQYGSENISKAQVENAISIANADFKRLNADTSSTRDIFKGVAANMDVEFRLAKIDPNGNCTEGIVRVASPLTDRAIPSNSVKNLSYWPADRYFNIWVVKGIAGEASGGLPIGGYAQFPDNNRWETYGVVVIHNGFGSIGTSSPGNSRLLTHEIGHCLNLYHTFETFFGNNCQQNSNCSTSGDKVCDTPPATLSQNCDLSRNSCTNDSPDLPDQIENYMGYNNSTCQNMFTEGQKSRSEAVFSADNTGGFAVLRNLISPANLQATGTNDGYITLRCAPIADFTTPTNGREIICQGASISFLDKSYNGGLNTDWTYNWSFPGGTPSTSTQPNPTITYNTPGIYNATLVVTNPAGSSDITKEEIIEVRSNVADITAPYLESFEDPRFPENVDDNNLNWEIAFSEESTWRRTTNAAFNGQASLFILNQDKTQGTISEIITPAVDLSAVPMPSKLYMRLAYARVDNNSLDELRVFSSFDCGRTWQQRFMRNASQLNSIGNGFVVGSTTFIPQTDEWKLDSVNLNQNQFSGQRNVLFKFQVISRGGNALYIDDVYVGSQVVSAGKPVSARQSFDVYPNPFSEELNLDFTLLQPENISIRIIDPAGREVISIAEKMYGPGSHTYELSKYLKNMAQGIYYLHFTSGDATTIKKVVYIK